MTKYDARFEDASDRPLRLKAADSEDLEVVSALVQDSVFTMKDISLTRQRRELAMLLNRFRWEDKELAEHAQRDYERVRAVLVLNDVTDVEAGDLAQIGEEAVLSLLAIAFTPGPDGTGTLTLTLSGDREIVAPVECLNVSLTDVSRPYRAPSRKSPSHR